MRRLVAGLPSAQELSGYELLFRQAETAENRAEFKQARRKIRFAQQRLPKVFSLLKIGANIFDYPGLLAVGSLGYGAAGARSFGYWLRVGGPPLEYNESKPTEFMVSFDEKGSITGIDDLVCRQ